MESQLLAAFAEFFADDGWDSAREVSAPVIRVKFKGENGQWGCFVHTIEEQERAAFYSVFPEHIPEDKRQLVAELLTRINFGIVIGNFELGMQDGALRYKTSIDVEGGTLTPPLVRQLVYSNVLTMDEYFPAIVSVLAGDETPERAVATVEGG